MVMELAELLEHEGLGPDELMDWAHRRAAALVAEVADDDDDPLAALLEPGADQVDMGQVPVGRRRTPSNPQPLSAAELPPPPEQPRLADGEPEPILETFHTGPIDLASPEAAALIAETSSREPAVDSEHADDELEEIEFDDLVELDDDELELLEEVSDSESPPPPPPPPSGPPALDAEAEHRPGDTATNLPTPALEDQPEDEAPVQTGDTAAHPAIDEAPVQTGDTAAHPAIDEAPVQTGDTAAHPVIDEAPVQTGDTAAHPIVDETEPSAASDDFDLDFDED